MYLAAAQHISTFSTICCLRWWCWSPRPMPHMWRPMSKCWILVSLPHMNLSPVVSKFSIIFNIILKLHNQWIRKSLYIVTLIIICCCCCRSVLFVSLRNSEPKERHQSHPPLHVKNVSLKKVGLVSMCWICQQMLAVSGLERRQQHRGKSQSLPAIAAWTWSSAWGAYLAYWTHEVVTYPGNIWQWWVTENEGLTPKSVPEKRLRSTATEGSQRAYPNPDTGR